METSPGDVPNTDPGWSRVWRHIWPEILFPLPHFALWRLARKGVDALTGVRAVFLTWVETPLLIIFVVSLISGDESDSGSVESPWFVAGVVAFDS